jgi:hypothetical protein
VDRRTSGPSTLRPGVPVALLHTATVLAGFGSRYFAVTSMSDADRRRQFFAPIIGRRRPGAVRVAPAGQASLLG